jgi:pimeloyl-ACP methyl ester carboxylesterase
LQDPEHFAPLAAFHGAKPPAPRWFEQALAHEPEREFIEVDGAKLETLAWGRRGLPGLILLHGGAAHSDWWSFIAPLFADRYRVVAPTFSGMGRSDWRPSYGFPQFAREARETGRIAGAFDAGPPVVVGHSFGSRVASIVAHDYAGEIAAAVVVDPPFFAPENRRPPNPPRASKTSHRAHASLGALVARFRLSPAQAVENLFILDHIARNSAREVVDAAGHRRWMLGFDPQFWEKLTRTEITPMLRAGRTPIALARGERSKLFKTADADYFLSLLPPGSPNLVLAEAEHHVMIDQPLAFVAMVQTLMESWPPTRGKR